MKIRIDYAFESPQKLENIPIDKDLNIIWKNGPRCDANTQRVILYDKKGKFLTTSIEEITWARGGYMDGINLEMKISLERENLKLKDKLNENGIHCDY